MTNLMAVSFHFSTNSGNGLIDGILTALSIILSIGLTVLFVVLRYKKGTTRRRKEIFRDNVNLSSDESENGNSRVIFNDVSSPVETQPTAQQKTQYCIYCGARLPENAKFCENCGAHVMD